MEPEHWTDKATSPIASERETDLSWSKAKGFTTAKSAGRGEVFNLHYKWDWKGAAERNRVDADSLGKSVVRDMVTRDLFSRALAEGDVCGFLLRHMPDRTARDWNESKRTVAEMRGSSYEKCFYMLCEAFHRTLSGEFDTMRGRLDESLGIAGLDEDQFVEALATFEEHVGDSAPAIAISKATAEEKEHLEKAIVTAVEDMAITTLFGLPSDDYLPDPEADNARLAKRAAAHVAIEGLDDDRLMTACLLLADLLEASQPEGWRWGKPRGVVRFRSGAEADPSYLRVVANTLRADASGLLDEGGEELATDLLADDNHASAREFADDMILMLCEMTEDLATTPGRVRAAVAEIPLKDAPDDPNAQSGEEGRTRNGDIGEYRAWLATPDGLMAIAEDDILNLSMKRMTLLVERSKVYETYNELNARTEKGKKPSHDTLTEMARLALRRMEIEGMLERVNKELEQAGDRRREAKHALEANEEDAASEQDDDAP